MNKVERKNIEEVNIIKKTKEIKDFLSYIITKDNKDLKLAPKNGGSFLNILVLDFIQEHYALITELERRRRIFMYKIRSFKLFFYKISCY